MIKFAIKWLGVLALACIAYNVFFRYISSASFTVAQVTLPWAIVAGLCVVGYGLKLEFKK